MLPYLMAVVEKGVVVVVVVGSSDYLVGCSIHFFQCTPYASKHLGEAMGTKIRSQSLTDPTQETITHIRYYYILSY